MKSRALTLCCSLAALPLIGCANGGGGPPQAYIPPAFQAYAPQADAPEANIRPVPTPSLAADHGGARIYASGSGAPAAILVMMPGGPGDPLTADPALWAAQGFDRRGTAA